MENFETKQRAYVGKFALKTDAGRLLHGGGVIAPRPRLYRTAAAAVQAAATIRGIGKLAPVKLI